MFSLPAVLTAALLAVVPAAAVAGDDDDETAVGEEDKDADESDDDPCSRDRYRRRQRKDGSTELLIPPECPLPPLPGEQSPPQKKTLPPSRAGAVEEDAAEEDEMYREDEDDRPQRRPARTRSRRRGSGSRPRGEAASGGWKSTISDDGTAVIGVGPATVEAEHEAPRRALPEYDWRTLGPWGRPPGQHGLRLLVTEGTTIVVFDGEILLGAEVANLRPAQRHRDRPEPPADPLDDPDTLPGNYTGDRLTDYLRGYARLGIGLELGEVVAARFAFEAGGGGVIGLDEWSGRREDEWASLHSAFLEGRWPGTGLVLRAGLVPFRDALDGMILAEELPGALLRWDLREPFETQVSVELQWLRLSEWVLDGADDVSVAGLDLVYGAPELDHIGLHLLYLQDRHGDGNVEIERSDETYLAITGSLRWPFLGLRADAAYDHGVRARGASSVFAGDSQTAGFLARVVLDGEIGPVRPLVDVLYSSGQTRLDADDRNEWRVIRPRQARLGALSRLELLTLNNDEYGWLSLTRAPGREDVVSSLATVPRPLTANNNDRGLTAVAGSIDYRPLGGWDEAGWSSFTIAALVGHARSSTRKHRSIGTEVDLRLSLEPVHGLLLQAAGAVLVPGDALDDPDFLAPGPSGEAGLLYKLLLRIGLTI